MSLAFRRTGRSRRNLVALALVWAVLLGMLAALNAAVWIVLFLWLFTLPLALCSRYECSRSNTTRQPSTSPH